MPPDTAAPPRILVVHPPVSVARDFIDYPYFANLGAAQLAAVLDDAGLDAVLVDAFALAGSTLAWRDDGRAHLGSSVSEVLDQCRAAASAPFAAIVVAYTPFHRPPHRDDILATLLSGLASLAAGAPVVLADCYQSGQHYVEAPGDAVLAAYPEASAWVKYESELTVPALLAALVEHGERPAGTHRGASVDKLDTLPFPAWGKLDLDALDRFRQRVVAHLGRGAWAFPIDGRTLPLVTSRGCPFVCVHCSSNPGREPSEAKTQRRYSAHRLREYLATLVRTHGATRLECLDELINVNERHFDAFLEEIHALGTRFDCPNGMRADYLEPRHFALMKGRVTTVSVSAESGVQRVVTEVVRKKLDLACVTAAAESAHAAGVPLMIHFMLGLPGETAAEMNGTLAFAMDLFDRFGAWPAVQFATPLPGTQLAEGRTLPVVQDWGPRFQTAPSQPGAAVSAETLRQFKWTFDQRLAASLGPQKLIMNVTYACNNHCTFCATGTRTQFHGHPTRQREHLLKYRRLGVTMVDFDGGEPTLNPELLPLVKYARHIGFDRVNVTTNGRTSFYEDYGRRLVQSGLTTLLFSVHGPDAQTHAQQVGVAEAFDQTLGGIRNALKHKPAEVELGMNVTLTKGNYEKLEQLAQLNWELGLRWLNIQFLTPFGRATSWVMPDTAHAAAITMGVIDRWQDRMKLQVINLPFCFMPGYERFMMGDLLKLQRHMVFVNNEDVNLAQYLAERRTRKPVCENCPHAVFCGGFYELENAPEPPWIIAPDDLESPVPPAPERPAFVQLGLGAR
jgi:MoaA/NifB/PqqE/SkfB family radical SAM enzyme